MPDGAAPSAPDDAGPQAASKSAVMTMGTGSSFNAFIVGLRLPVTKSLCVGLPTATAPPVHGLLTTSLSAVSCRVSRNVDPADTSLRTLMPPPSKVAFSSAMARPSPLPPPERAGSAL